MSKILMITPYFRPAKCGGGGQVSIENLADLLTREHQVNVVCYNRDFGSSYKISTTLQQKENKLTVLYLSFGKLQSVLKLIRSIKYDYIYFNSFFSPICIFFQFYYFFSSSVKIVSPKGEFYDGAFSNKSFKKSLWLAVYKKLFRRTKFHATSQHEEPIIKERFGSAKVSIAPDIPSSVTVGNDTKSYGKRFRIIYLSRIDPKKNLAFIPEVLRQLEFDIVFDIWGDIGDNIYFEECLKMLKALPKNITWQFKGRLDFAAAKQIFLSYDLFLFPTKGENYGHVVFESLSCGCPVLLSKDTTPWNDLAEYGVGCNISLSDNQTWLDKITWFNFLTNDERSIVSEGCRNYIRSKYDIALIKNENLNLFRKEHVWR